MKWFTNLRILPFYEAIKKKQQTNEKTLKSAKAKITYKLEYNFSRKYIISLVLIFILIKF